MRLVAFIAALLVSCTGQTPADRPSDVGGDGDFRDAAGSPDVGADSLSDAVVPPDIETDVETDQGAQRIRCVTTHRELSGDLAEDVIGAWYHIPYMHIDGPLTYYVLEPGGVLRIVRGSGNYDEEPYTGTGSWAVEGTSLIFEEPGGSRGQIANVIGIYPAAMDLTGRTTDGGWPWFRVKCEGFGFEGSTADPEPTCAAEPDPDGHCHARFPGTHCMTLREELAACAEGVVYWGVKDDVLEFTNVPVGSSQTQTLHIENFYAGRPKIVEVSVSDSAFVVDPEPSPEDPIVIDDYNFYFDVTYTATDGEARDETLTIVTDEDEVEVELLVMPAR